MNYSCRLLITKLYSIQLLSHRCEGLEVHSRACEWPQRQAGENADCSAMASVVPSMTHLSFLSLGGNDVEYHLAS